MSLWEMIMKADPIVEEVHAVRDAIARKYNNDLSAICDDARKRQSQSSHRVVKLPPRKAKQSAKAQLS